MLWRQMTKGDLSAVVDLAGSIYPRTLYEDRTIFEERFKLHPSGCFILENEDGAPQGYAIAHPWRMKTAPELNTRIDKIPQKPTTIYIHDVAVSETMRGFGAGSSIVNFLESDALSRGYHVSAVALAGSHYFWMRRGYRKLMDVPVASYGDGARFCLKEFRY